MTSGGMSNDVALRVEKEIEILAENMLYILRASTVVHNNFRLARKMTTQFSKRVFKLTFILIILYITLKEIRSVESLSRTVAVIRRNYLTEDFKSILETIEKRESLVRTQLEKNRAFRGFLLGEVTNILQEAYEIYYASRIK